MGEGKSVCYCFVTDGKVRVRHIWQQQLRVRVRRPDVRGKGHNSAAGA